MDKQMTKVPILNLENKKHLALNELKPKLLLALIVAISGSNHHANNEEKTPSIKSLCVSKKIYWNFIVMTP